jgi:hypothetical protein
MNNFLSEETLTFARKMIHITFILFLGTSKAKKQSFYGVLF